MGSRNEILECPFELFEGQFSSRTIKKLNSELSPDISGMTSVETSMLCNQLARSSDGGAYQKFDITPLTFTFHVIRGAKVPVQLFFVNLSDAIIESLRPALSSDINDALNFGTNSSYNR